MCLYVCISPVWKGQFHLVMFLVGGIHKIEVLHHDDCFILKTKEKE